MSGMPVQLGVICDSPDCGGNFEDDFMVAEDSTRDERLAVVLRHVEKHGWRVIWHQPVSGSRTYCPDCARPDCRHVWDQRNVCALCGHDPLAAVRAATAARSRAQRAGRGRRKETPRRPGMVRQRRSEGREEGNGT